MKCCSENKKQQLNGLRKRRGENPVGNSGIASCHSFKRFEASVESLTATEERDGDIITGGLQVSSERERERDRESEGSVMRLANRKIWLVDENVVKFSVSVVAYDKCYSPAVGTR